MPATNYTQPTKAAENRSMTTSTVMGMIPHRRLARSAFTLLATVLLLAVLSVKAQAQAQDVTLVFSRSSVAVPEDGNESVSYGIKLDNQPDMTMTMTVVSSNLAIATVDPALLSFTTSNWNRYQTVTVTGVPDSVDNLNDTRKVTINHCDASDVCTPLEVVVIDDDTAGLSIIPETRLTVPEEDDETGGSVLLRVKLDSAPRRGTVLVRVTAKTDESVIFGGEKTIDFTFTADDWNHYQHVLVLGKDDDIDNYNDSRLVGIKIDPSNNDLSVVGDYNAVDSVEMSVTITDNDDAGFILYDEDDSILPKELPLDEGTEEKVYKISLKTIPSGNVDVYITSGDPNIATVTSPSPITFTPENWSGPQDFTVTSVPDSVDNDGRSVRIEYMGHGGGYDDVTAEIKVTITDNDDKGLMVAIFPSEISNDGTIVDGKISVSLKSEPTRNVTVTVRSTEPAIATASTSLMFTPGNWEKPQDVTVVGVNDGVEREGSRSVDIMSTATGGDYRGITKKVVVEVNSAPVVSGMKITSPSDPMEDIASPFEVMEDADPREYSVSLKSEPPRNVTVMVKSTDPAIAKVQPTSLKFTIGEGGNWEEPQNVAVVGVDNDVAASLSVTITHSVSGLVGVTGKHHIKVKVINETTDIAGLMVSDDSILVSENRGRDTYTVNLMSEPTANVIVDLRVIDATPDATPDAPPAVATVSPQSLTFTPRSWETTRTVIVTGMNNDVDIPNREKTITHHIVSGDAVEYNAVIGAANYRPVMVMVMVIDDDAAKLTVTPKSLIISQGRTDTFTVKLNTEPVSSVTVTAQDFDESVVAVSPTSRVFTSADWHTPKVFTVIGEGSRDTIYIDRKQETRIKITTDPEDYHASPGYVDVTVTDEDIVVAPAGLTVTPTSLALSQGRTGTYTVKLKARPRGAVTVTAASNNEDAATVSPESRTFTSANWDTAQEFTVTGVASSDSTATITITNTASGSGYEDVSASVSVTVRVAGLILSEDAVTVTEASGAEHTDTYTVGLETQPTGTVTVAVASSDTAAAMVNPTRLTFTTSDWSTAQTVTVTGVDDFTDNAADKRTVTISNHSSGAGYSAAATVTVTVTDDDAAPELLIEGASVSEGNTGTTPLTFTVTKHGATDQRVTVYYKPGTGTAMAGTDYTVIAPGTLTFAYSETSKTITVMVQGDDVSEPDETVVIELSNPSNATIAEGTATGTIIDDDASRLSIEAGAASVDESEPLIFTVSLDPPIDDEQVTVDLTTAGTATAGTDYMAVPGTLTFTAGEGSKTITVAVADDDDYELDETVEVELRNPKPTGSVVIETGVAMVTIEDNDDSPALSISGTSIAEGNDGTTNKLTFKVTKSGGTSMEATVAYTDAGMGTATAGTDYTAVAAGTLTFAYSETSKTITVVVKGDDVSEDDETVVIRLRSPSNATIAEGKGEATGTIIDDDTMPRVATDWLARFGRTAAGATLDAIARRMNDGAAGVEPALTVAGRRAAFAPGPVAQAAAGTAAPWEEGWARALTIEELANGSSFDAGANFVEGLNVWGATSYNQFEMTPQGTYTMDGSLVSAILGVDHQGDTHVAGLALAYHGGDGDFSGIGKTEGSLGTNLYSVHPYVRLTFGEAFHVGGSIGIGTGDLRITDKGGGALVETGVGMPVLAAVDARMELSLAEAWILALQADGHLVQMVADEQLPRFTRVETNTHRLRLGVENSYVFLITDGVSLAPVLETGLRYDGGDGETGVGFDIGGGLRLDVVEAGLMVDARGSVSLNNWGEGQEQAPALRNWGIGGVIRWRPAAGSAGMGPQVSLAPSMGSDAAARMNAEVGYRVAAFGSGVLTPYGAAEFSGAGAQTYRAGAHLELDQGLELRAEGTRRQSSAGAAQHYLTVQLRLLQ